jgi:hypothetical protein
MLQLSLSLLVTTINFLEKSDAGEVAKLLLFIDSYVADASTNELITSSNCLGGTEAPEEQLTKQSNKSDFKIFILQSCYLVGIGTGSGNFIVPTF